MSWPRFWTVVKVWRTHRRVTRLLKLGLGIGAALFIAIGCATTIAAYYAVSVIHARKLFDEGYTAMNRHDYVTASRRFDEALRKHLDPYHTAYAYLDRGFCQEKLRHPDDALRDYSEAIRIKPSLAEAYAYRGALHDERKEKDDAFHDYSEAIRLDSNAAGPLYHRGLIFLERKELDKALTDFSEALRASPNYAAAYTQRGIVYAFKREWDAALASFDSAIGIDPKSTLAYEQRAYVHRRKDETDKAIADYTEAIRLEPERAETYRSRAILLNKAHRPDEAIADFAEAIRLNSKDQISLEQLAIAYERKDDPERTIVDFSAIIDRYPSRKAYEYRARAYAKKGDYVSAMADFKQARQMDGDGLNWGKGLPWLLSTCPDALFRNGKEAIAEAIKDCQAAHWNSWNCVDTLAAAYAEDGDFEQAIRFEQEALLKRDCNVGRRAEIEKRIALYKQHLPYRDAMNARK